MGTGYSSSSPQVKKPVQISSAVFYWKLLPVTGCTQHLLTFIPQSNLCVGWRQGPGACSGVECEGADSLGMGRLERKEGDEGLVWWRGGAWQVTQEVPPAPEISEALNS